MQSIDGGRSPFSIETVLLIYDLQKKNKKWKTNRLLLDGTMWSLVEDICNIVVTKKVFALVLNAISTIQVFDKVNKKLSWCWQTCATRLEVSQGHQT